MRLRPYIHAKDYQYVEKWTNNERIHSLWCANLIPYPMTEKNLQDILAKDSEKWGSSPYVVTEDSGTPIGFFAYSVNTSDNSGFLKFILLDDKLRGKGYGTQMLTLVLKYAFEITGVSSVQLNVFDINTNAKRCYSNVGFKQNNIVRNSFTYKKEFWGRCHMVISK